MSILQSLCETACRSVGAWERGSVGGYLSRPHDPMPPHRYAYQLGAPNAYIVPVVLFLFFMTAAPATAQQPDSTRADTAFAPVIRLNTLPVGHTPDGALWRAAVLPGWGQVYNGQYWKLPLVYAGLGGLVYSAVYFNRRYWLFRHAYEYLRFPDRYPQGQDEAIQLQNFIEQFGEDAVRTQRKTYRRYFELSIVGSALFYGLTVVDAYVSAHLLSFQVNDNMAIEVMPRTNGAALRLRF